MPRTEPLKNDFSAGEFSPLVQARVDADLYAKGLAKCLNYVPTLEGPLTRLPGTLYAEETDGENGTASVIIPFEYSRDDAYIIEISDTGFIRFFKNNAIIESGGNPYEIAHSLDIDEPIGYVQDADAVYLFQEDLAPQKLVRVSDASWSIDEADFFGGPFLSSNDTYKTMTLTRSGTTGTIISGPAATVTGAADNGSGLIRITCSGGHSFLTGDFVIVSAVGGVPAATNTTTGWEITRISSTVFDLVGSTFAGTYTSGGSAWPAIFNITSPAASSDAGRMIRVIDGVNTYDVRAGQGGTTSAHTMGVDMVDPPNDSGGATSAVTTWRLGSWGGPNRFPRFGTFHDDRLCVAGVRGFPKTVWGSVPADYENFETDDEGTPTAGSAFEFGLSGSDLNQIEWLESDGKGLLMGTGSGTQILKAGTSTEALSALNVSADRNDGTGSAAVFAARVNTTVVYAQKGGKTLRDLIYQYDVEKFNTTNISRTAPHLLLGVVAQIVVQQQPYPILWVRLDDGSLVGCLYDRDSGELTSGFFEVTLGGRSDFADTPPLVESLAIIPSSDGTEDQLWMVVKRIRPALDGFGAVQVIRTVEYLDTFFGEDTDQRDAMFLDAAVRPAATTFALPGVLQAENPLRLECESEGGASGFASVGDIIFFRDIEGMSQLGIRGYEVTEIDGVDVIFAGIDASEWDAQVENWTVEPKYRIGTTSVTGLDHMEGETVGVYADGYVLGNETVSGGAITIDTPSGWVTVGYNKTAQAKLLRFEAGSASGVALGKLRRTHRASLLLHRTLGLKIGMDFDSMDEITFSDASDDVNAPTPLHSGWKHEELDCDSDYDNHICFEQSDPLPGTILAVIPRMELQDGG